MSECRDDIKEDTNTNFNIDILEKYIRGNKVYDKTFSRMSSILHIPDREVYIKIAKLNSLKEEYENTVFFNKLGVAGEVIEYIQDDYNDYLIVKEVKGENGISSNHMSNPEKLATSFGKHLRMIHSLDYDVCPGINRTNNLFDKCSTNTKDNKIHMDMDIFFKKYGFTPNQGILMLDRLKDFAVDDVYIHGDYYLPNIVMQDYEFMGIVDMDCSGLGDRHIDIASGLISLEMNFKTKEYNDIFLDGYGRDLIDKNRLALAKLLIIFS